VLKISLVAVSLPAAMILGVYRRFFKTESQTESLANMVTGNPHDPAIKALLERTRDLSDKQKKEAERELEDRLGDLRKNFEEETDAEKQSELADTISEIDAELEELKIVRWWDTHVSSNLDRVIGRERPRIKARRERAAEEFRVALIENELRQELERLRTELEQEKDGEKRNEIESRMEEARATVAKYVEEGGGLSPAQTKHRDRLAAKGRERRPVGLAFSGGGIRSAIFNLGLVQGLAKYGFLPWVDYVTSVSGGGLTAACMTTLLLRRRNESDRAEGDGSDANGCPFNTQWDKFPFNPELKAFDVQQTDDTTERSGEVCLSLAKGTNKQLQYLRDNGNFIIPRMGWVTRDVLRGIGAFLATIAYTLAIFFLALCVFAAFHYGATAALTPSILGSVQLGERTAGQVQEPGQLSVNLWSEGRELVIDLPVGLPKQEEDVPESGEIEAEALGLLQLVFGDYQEGPGARAPEKTSAIEIPPEYGSTLVAGFVIAYLMGSILTILYSRYPCTQHGLKGRKSPQEGVTLGAYLAISSIRLFAHGCLLGLAALTLWLWIRHYQLWSQSGTPLPAFYWAWGLFFLAFALIALWFVRTYARDYRWAKFGLPEQLRVDNLVKYVVAGLFLWVMLLWISQLRLRLPGASDPGIFWILLPAVFALGSMIGLAIFRIFPVPWRVTDKADVVYTNETLSWLDLMYFKMLKVEKDLDCGQDPPPDPPRKVSPWSIVELRSIYWTMQGLVLYGFGAFILSSLLALPHYFSVGTAADPNTVVPLATAIISAGWAAFLSSVNRMGDTEPKNLLARILALPEGARRYVLGILVIALNLSIIFLIQSVIDSISVESVINIIGIESVIDSINHESVTDSISVALAYAAGVGAAVLLGAIGWFANFNYLTPHYFARDRIAEVFMKTEIGTKTGQVRLARDDRDTRLMNLDLEGCSAPFHIVMTALNLPGSWHLKHKDRQSEPFIFSTYYCGSDTTGYVDTVGYREGLTKYSRAIALSGAAASPGLGYHTFFAQAFMTTLLNVRLGLWMTSPQQYAPDVLTKYAKPHQRETRSFWPVYLGDEALARISERRPLVNLTDGEHTGDGIGLYPLFQRRCKIIIAGDGSGDPAGQATGLYRVLRQVKVDLGIEVDINVDGTKPALYDRENELAEPSQRHFAVGKIAYPPTFDDQGTQLSDGFMGWLIYFKTAVTKRDPKPILNYWETHKMDFPSPSTVDQFFDEEQWEFQRWLGEFTVEDTLRELRRYCEEKIRTLHGEWEDDTLEEIEELDHQMKLAEACLRRDAEYYGLLDDPRYPDPFEVVMSMLYEISCRSDVSSEK
jgi:hypothetical protein